MWQREDDNTARTWANAITYCENLTLAGYTDWRLPSKKELITIAGQTFVITQSDTAFADVLSTNVFYSYINAIYNAGITAGCSQNPLMYCPDAGVTRGEMAAFISRAFPGMP